MEELCAHDLMYLRWFLIPTFRWLYQPWKKLDCFYFSRFVVATYCQKRNAKVLIYFNSHCIRTFSFIWKEYWVRETVVVWRTTGDAKALKWNSMYVCLTSNAYLQIILGEVNLVGMRQVSLFGRRGGAKRNGTLGK